MNVGLGQLPKFLPDRHYSILFRDVPTDLGVWVQGLQDRFQGITTKNRGFLRHKSRPVLGSGFDFAEPRNFVLCNAQPSPATFGGTLPTVSAHYVE